MKAGRRERAPERPRDPSSAGGILGTATSSRRRRLDLESCPSFRRRRPCHRARCRRCARQARACGLSWRRSSSHHRRRPAPQRSPGAGIVRKRRMAAARGGVSVAWLPKGLGLAVIAHPAQGIGCHTCESLPVRRFVVRMMVFEHVFAALRCESSSRRPPFLVSQTCRTERRVAPRVTRVLILLLGPAGKTRRFASTFWLLEATLPLLSRIERKLCSRTLYASLGDQLLKRGRGLLRRQCVPTALASNAARAL